MTDFSGVGRGPLKAGDRVTLTDPKGRKHTLILESGKTFHTTKGMLSHDDIIGQPEGIIVTTKLGLDFLVFRPLLNEYLVTMPRKAAIVYPKEAAQISMWTDIFPGARVVEAGVGSGALSTVLLRAIGETGTLRSYERRKEFADIARTNVKDFFGFLPPSWTITIGDLARDFVDEPADRMILDMLAPWECIDVAARLLVPGGMLCCYVTTTTQMGRVIDALRAHGSFIEPTATETTTRVWHAEGLAIRPGHGTTPHTGFLVTTRRLGPGVLAPMRKRRPAPGAYGPDYHGPVPRNVSAQQLEDNRRRAEEAGREGIR